MSACDPSGRAHHVAGSMHKPLCRGIANSVLAGLAQCGEVFLHAQHQAPCAELYSRALLPDIRLAGITHCRGLHERGLAQVVEFLEMRLDTLSKSISFRSARVAT